MGGGNGSRGEWRCCRRVLRWRKCRRQLRLSPGGRPWWRCVHSTVSRAEESEVSFFVAVAVESPIGGLTCRLGRWQDLTPAESECFQDILLGFLCQAAITKTRKRWACFCYGWIKRKMKFQSPLVQRSWKVTYPSQTLSPFVIQG